jgi:hypothetical protein
LILEIDRCGQQSGSRAQLRAHPFSLAHVRHARRKWLALRARQIRITFVRWQCIKRLKSMQCSSRWLTAGIAATLRLLLPSALALVTHGVIEPSERYLDRRFGAVN